MCVCVCVPVLAHACLELTERQHLITAIYLAACLGILCSRQTHMLVKTFFGCLVNVWRIFGSCSTATENFKVGFCGDDALRLLDYHFKNMIYFSVDFLFSFN